jgi:hypothetical protein
VQPLVHVRRADVRGPGFEIALMRDDRFIFDFDTP